MESSGTTPPGGLPPAAVPEIAAVFDGRPPFVTVYLATEAAVEQAAQQSELRWKTLRRELSAAGAPEETLSAIDPLVPDAHHEGRTLAVIGDASGLRLVRHEPEPPARDAGWVAPLPRVGPLLEWAQGAVPHLVVLADRAGADIVAFSRRAAASGAGGAADVVTVGEDTGSDPDLRKSNPGGWSQRRYQNRAENLWEHNAKAVADQVASLVDETRARLVVVTGDVRALQFLRDHLPQPVLDIVREVEGSRGPGAADAGLDRIADEVVKLVASVAAEDTVEFLRQFKQEEGQHDLATQGVGATLAALAAARVDTLMIHDDPDDGRTAWFGPEPGMVGETEAAITELGTGAGAPQQARLVDVAIRAAFTSGAAVRMIPSVASVQDGIGAILRF
ncbi:MAG TPA: Vms1/Ankzf1 family peptidyl-tRNA hydrolase [Acidimicrobiia bacterium]|nr:Vms1/Ankzf1 family peptidyl-tRNA hydrolase [Acidimicrobiia bacterium]